ncbi:hypothetical protein NDU88_000260 [Pleurodeles waltl]|uniref:Secreted protein n=1 Tax=Pleurodeles waltl TaxID=8319 RepID=A0AAV7SW00_PLEWA|nr:hypothetical protein NDU88_000260 [Pleurodeles waltl]
MTAFIASGMIVAFEEVLTQLQVCSVNLEWKRCVGYVYTCDHPPRALPCDRAVIACDWILECFVVFEGCGERRRNRCWRTGVEAVI